MPPLPGSSAGSLAPSGRVVARCPWGLPAVTEQDPYGPGRRAVPDHLLPHVPTSRRGRVSRLEAAAGSSAGAPRSRPTRRCATTSTAPPPSSVASVGSSRPASRHGRRSLTRPRHRWLAQPDCPRSASMPMSPSLSPARGIGSGGRSRRVLGTMAPALLHGCPRRLARMTTVSAARREWEDGESTLRGGGTRPARADALHAQHDAILEELRRRVGPTFTLAELASAYAGSERWLREVVEERAPFEGMDATVSLAGDAAFHTVQPSGAGLHPVTIDPLAANRRRAPRRSRLWPRVLAVVAAARSCSRSASPSVSRSTTAPSPAARRPSSAPSSRCPRRSPSR